MLEWKQDNDGDWSLYVSGVSVSWIQEVWDFEENIDTFMVANVKDEERGGPSFKMYKTLAGAKREGMKQAKAWLEELLRVAG